MPELSLGVTLLVLGAALLHAGWNAMVKSSRDVLLDITNVIVWGGIAALPLLAVIDAPARASWPYLAASVVIHIGYYIALVGAYRAGDLSHGYPIMRGVAPLLVAVASAAWFGEVPPATMWLGVLLICGGVLSLGLAGFHWKTSRVSTGWALANAAMIASYTLVDAAGVRASGSPAGYVLWMFVIDALVFPLFVLAARKRVLIDYVRQSWLRGVVGGALSGAAYGIALWAMTRAPVAAVAALRETSVVFAALIGAYLLKEGHAARRFAGAAIVLLGIIFLKI
jgi:drug/metabolite transporter (DMT)-like permease